MQVSVDGFNQGWNELHGETGGGGMYDRPQYVWDRPERLPGPPDQFWDPADVAALVAKYGPDWNNSDVPPGGW